MLKLKLQYFGHPIQRADSLEMTLRLAKIEGRKKRGQHGMLWLDSITDPVDMCLSKLQENSEGQGGLVCYSLWGHKELDTTLQLNNSDNTNNNNLLWLKLLSCKISCLYGKRSCGRDHF